MRFFLSVLLLIALDSHSQWKADKLDNNTLVHFSVGMSTGMLIAPIANSPKSRLWIGIVSSTTLGILKEVYDARGAQHAQVYDVVATSTGGAVGALVINWSIYRISKKKRSQVSREMNFTDNFSRID
jgi:hypothetical protein